MPETEGPLFHPPALRKDCEIIKVQEHVYFQTYWKVVADGKGPATILYLFGIETIKFDCLGKDKGHFHVNPNNPEPQDGGIILIPEKTCREQITRCVFEFQCNIGYYISRNIDKRICNLKFNTTKWKNALMQVEKNLNHLLDTVPELDELK